MSNRVVVKDMDLVEVLDWAYVCWPHVSKNSARILFTAVVNEMHRLEARNAPKSGR